MLQHLVPCVFGERNAFAHSVRQVENAVSLQIDIDDLNVGIGAARIEGVGQRLAHAAISPLVVYCRDG